MARLFSGVKIMSNLVPHGFFNALIRRGYTAEAMAASQRVASSSAAEGVTARSDGLMKKEAERSSEKAAWVPDPVTGYYRPENYADEIDAVDLRAKLLKPRRNIIN